MSEDEQDAARYRAIRSLPSPFMVWDCRYTKNGGMIYLPDLDGWIDSWLTSYKAEHGEQPPPTWPMKRGNHASEEDAGTEKGSAEES